MIRMQTIEEILKCVLWTGYIKGEKPVSLLVVAEPEEGKTSILEKAKYLKGIVYLTDTTAFGIMTELEKVKANNEKINHIIIPDLLAPLSKQKSTRDTFVAFLNPLIEEGISYIRTGVINLKYEFQCGLISAVTKDKWRACLKEWRGKGFISRLVPMSYSYTLSTLNEIFKSVVKLEYKNESILSLDFPEEKVEVVWDEGLGEKLLPITVMVGTKLGTHGIRLQKQLQVMMRAHALMNGRKKVTQQDFDAMVKFSDYINFDFKKI